MYVTHNLCLGSRRQSGSNPEILIWESGGDSNPETFLSEIWSNPANLDIGSS